MAYLLLAGERTGQLVYPGAKRHAFTNEEIELALGGRGYTKIAAGRVRQFNDVPHVMLVAAGGGEINREAMLWLKSGAEIRGPVMIVAKDQLPTGNKKTAKAGASRRRARIETKDGQGERRARSTNSDEVEKPTDVGQDLDSRTAGEPLAEARGARTERPSHQAIRRSSGPAYQP